MIDVILLLAGESKRLHPLTFKLHKSMLKLSDGLSILEHQFQAFEKCRLDSIKYVVGHASHLVIEKIDKIKNNVLVHHIYNDLYNKLNMDHSVLLGLQSSQNDVLYYEGDILIEPKYLKYLANSNKNIALLYDSALKNTVVDMILVIDDGKYQIKLKEHGSFSNNERSNSTTLGEFVCIFKIEKIVSDYLVDKLRSTERGGNLKIYDFLTSAMSIFSTEIIDINGSNWIEVDNRFDLSKACEVYSK